MFIQTVTNNVIVFGNWGFLPRFNCTHLGKRFLVEAKDYWIIPMTDVIWSSQHSAMILEFGWIISLSYERRRFVSCLSRETNWWNRLEVLLSATPFAMHFCLYWLKYLGKDWIGMKGKRSKGRKKCLQLKFLSHFILKIMNTVFDECHFNTS